jgi:short-subunit dehydrogenase
MYANKKILITGASSRLGKAIATAYVREKDQIINLSRNVKK